MLQAAPLWCKWILPLTNFKFIAIPLCCSLLGLQVLACISSNISNFTAPTLLSFSLSGFPQAPNTPGSSPQSPGTWWPPIGNTLPTLLLLQLKYQLLKGAFSSPSISRRQFLALILLIVHILSFHSTNNSLKFNTCVFILCL